MGIFLFTDFGSADIYAGQVRSVLHQHVPDVRVIDLFHDAPAFNIRAAAHLLAALANRLPMDSVTVAVVDPGVGGARAPVVVSADNRWYVGPDNGLISVVVARAHSVQIFPITGMPEQLSASFHGRDLFAPVAARIASGELRAEQLPTKAQLDVEFGADDLAEVIYIDHYGNAFTGLRAGKVLPQARVVAGGREVGYARVFSEVPAGEAFWYENSLGLLELAANSASAAVQLGLKTGAAISFAK
jgi:S-adenosylmethionine hydrolase